MALETTSAESAYCTKPNIIIAKTEPRTATVLAQVATDHQQLNLNDGDGPRSVADSDATLPTLGNALTATLVTATEVWTSTAHGLAVGDRVRAIILTGATGMALNTDYFVITAPDADTFTLSATAGGTVLATSVDGTAPCRLIKVNYITAGGDDAVVTYGVQSKEA